MSRKSFQEYMALERRMSPHTVRSYDADIRAFASFLGSEDDAGIERVGYPDIRAWIAHLIDSGLTNNTVNRKVASLRAYYRFLLNTGVRTDHPLTLHKGLPAGRKVQLPFSDREMERLFQLDPFDAGFEGVRDRAIVHLFYATGIRRAELIGLRVGDYDASGSQIRVLGKRDKERVIPLLGESRNILEAYLAVRNESPNAVSTDALFLTARGRNLYPKLVYRIINMYLQEVSSKVKTSPHILRHTFATHLLNNGADFNSVKELLGHSSLAATQVYTGSGIAELKQVHRAAHPRGEGLGPDPSV